MHKASPDPNNSRQILAGTQTLHEKGFHLLFFNSHGHVHIRLYRFTTDNAKVVTLRTDFYDDIAAVSYALSQGKPTPRLYLDPHPLPRETSALDAVNGGPRNL